MNINRSFVTTNVWLFMNMTVK